MSEFASPAPPENFDQILKSRTLSDAELLNGGAEYENGVLKPTSEQIETLRYRYEAQLGKIGLEQADVVLHTDGIGDLDYLYSESAVENEARLSSQIHDLTSRYVDAVTSYFPKELKRFRKTADSSLETSSTQHGETVNYTLTFRSEKREVNDEKVMQPKVLWSQVDRFGKNHVANYNSSDKFYHPRDIAQYSLTGDKSIGIINLTTRLVSPDCGYMHQLNQKTLGPHDKGIVPDLLRMIDESPLPPTQVYDENKFDSRYDAHINLSDKYSLTFSKHAVKQTYSLKSMQPETVTYVFDQQKNCFVKSEGSTWDIGPEELDVSAFTNIVKQSLSNIPTVNV